jgi:hypothetical protein
MSGDKSQLRPEEISLPGPSRSWGPVLAPLLGLAVIAAVAWAVHQVWPHFDSDTYIFTFIYLWLPAAATKVFYNYRRQFRPERLPSMLSEDSEELAKLKRKRMLLGRVGWSVLGLCVLLGFTIRLFNGVHPGEVCYLIPDVVWPWIALPLLAGFISLFWGDVLAAQIKQRTPPAAKPVGASRGRRNPTVITGTAFQGNGFHSDHWGERGSHVPLEFAPESKAFESESQAPKPSLI